MPKQKVKATKLTVGLPFNLGSLEVESNPDSEKIAWELYIEIITRLPPKGVPLNPSEDLTFLFDIINVTRQILRQSGPSISRWPNPLGTIAIDVINKGIRPFLGKWHPILNGLHHDIVKNSKKEVQQDKILLEFNQDFDKLQSELIIYIEALAKLAGVD